MSDERAAFEAWWVTVGDHRAEADEDDAWGIWQAACAAKDAQVAQWRYLLKSFLSNAGGFDPTDMTDEQMEEFALRWNQQYNAYKDGCAAKDKEIAEAKMFREFMEAATEDGFQQSHSASAWLAMFTEAMALFGPEVRAALKETE